jgi:hypothetical protein
LISYCPETLSQSSFPAEQETTDSFVARLPHRHTKYNLFTTAMQHFISVATIHMPSLAIVDFKPR